MRKFLLILLLLFAVAGISAAFYAYFYIIPQEIEKKVTARLNELGFKKVVFESISKTTDSIIFNNISLDTKSFSGIKSITVKYSLWSYFLKHGKAQRITVNKLHLTGDVAQNLNFKIAGWRNDGKILKTLAQIPANIIIFEDSSIDLLTPVLGGITVNYEAQIHQNDTKEIEINGRLNSKQKTFELEARISGAINQNGNLEIHAESNNVNIETNNLKARRADIIATFLAFPDNKTQLSLEANAGSALWFGFPLRDTNVTLEKSDGIYQLYGAGQTAGSTNIEYSGQIRFNPDNLSFDGSIYPPTLNDFISYLQSNKRLSKSSFFPSSILALKKPALNFEGSIPYNKNLVSGAFKVSSPNPAFEISGNFQSNDNLKNVLGGFSLPFSQTEFFLENPAEDAELNITPDMPDIESGKNEKEETKNLDLSYGSLNISAVGKYNVDLQAPEPILNWAFKSNIEKSTFHYLQIPLTNIEGMFLFSSLNPQRDNLLNKLSFQLPLPLWSKQIGEIWVSLNPPDNNIIQKILLKIYGGTIEAGPISTQNGKLPENIILEVADINLSDFIQALRISGLYMIGKMGGQLPLEIKNKKLHLNKGLLQSQQSGVLQVPDSIAHILFPDENPDMKTIRAALKNYHYEFFEIRLDGSIDGSVMVSVIANGYNPDYTSQAGMTELKFQIETQLSELFKHIINP